MHRALNVEPDRLRNILCYRDQRYVGNDLTFRYNRKRVRLDVNDLTRTLVGKYVDTYETAQGSLQVRAQGVVLPHAIFDPDQQRVTHAAITEHKRLGAVLAYIKKEQDQKPPKVRVPPSSARNGYKKIGRRNDSGDPKPPDAQAARPAGAAKSEVSALSGRATPTKQGDTSALHNQ